MMDSGTPPARHRSPLALNHSDGLEALRAMWRVAAATLERGAAL
jgi:hypothetical protein